MANTDEILISASAVRARLGGVSRPTLRRWVQRGILPAPTPICGRNYWRERDVATLQANGTRSIPDAPA